MKKVFLFVAVIASFSFVSCTKDHVCTCTTTPTSGTVETYTVTYFESHKKNARLACEMESSQYAQVTPVAATGDKTTCELK